MYDRTKVGVLIAGLRLPNKPPPSSCAAARRQLFATAGRVPECTKVGTHSLAPACGMIPPLVPWGRHCQVIVKWLRCPIVSYRSVLYRESSKHKEL